MKTYIRNHQIRSALLRVRLDKKHQKLMNQKIDLKTAKAQADCWVARRTLRILNPELK